MSDPLDDQQITVSGAALRALRDEFQRFLMEYRFGLAEVETKISILREEFQEMHAYNPIEHVSSRVKSPDSLVDKVRRKGIEADFDSSRYAWNDAHRSTPIELGWSWMFKGLKSDDRPFIGRKALEKEIAEKTSRWAMRGLVVDWQDYDRVYNEAGLIPPKDHTPIVEDWMLYDEDYERVGYATSFMYSPMLQRHIALARVRPDFAKFGTKVDLEFTVDHHYVRVAAHVARLPLYNPERKTA